MSRWFGLFSGICACVMLAGCGSHSDGEHGHSHEAPSASQPAAPAAAAEEHGHDHEAEGPHGGYLIVLGSEEYHAELAHDEAAHTVRVHLLDAAGKAPVKADEPEVRLQVFKDGRFVDYTLKAGADASEFSLADEALCDLLLHADEVRGRLHVSIAGKEYTGSIEHEHAH